MKHHCTESRQIQPDQQKKRSHLSNISNTSTLLLFNADDELALFLLAVPSPRAVHITKCFSVPCCRPKGALGPALGIHGAVFPCLVANDNALATGGSATLVWIKGFRVLGFAGFSWCSTNISAVNIAMFVSLS